MIRSENNRQIVNIWDKVGGAADRQNTASDEADRPQSAERATGEDGKERQRE